jgi:DNA repair protein SbcD/Mre11
MIKVAQVSDLHYSGRNLDESDRCFAFAVDEAIARGAELAVVTGDSTDHALDVHSPAVERLVSQVRRLADHCPVLMLQGTYSHEPPGTLSIFPFLGGRHPVHVADRISQVALTHHGRWLQSDGWRFDAVPPGARALLTCVPTVNKATVAATVGATQAAEAVGCELTALLAGFGAVNGSARRAGVPTLGLSHGTVSGCTSEHGVPMAGLDHEFTTTSLFDANAQAFLLGHIHKHQHWSDSGRVIAYAGSIGRFHYGEPDPKGFLLWQIGADTVRFELIQTPARRTVDLVFDGAPDVEAIAEAVRAQGLVGAHVRVRWSIGEEDRAQVDRAAIERALAGAAGVQLEGRVVPVRRSRAHGISRAATLEQKVAAWSRVTGVDPAPLLQRLVALSEGETKSISEKLLASDGDGKVRTLARAATEDDERGPRQKQLVESDLF